MMYGTLRIDFGFEAAGRESQLRSVDDVEVVVCCVSAGVAFSSNGGTEDDQVFC